MNGRDPAPQRRRVGGWPIAATLAVLAIVLYAVRYALLPFVFAVAVAFVADPLIARVQRRLGLPRWPVAAALYAAFLAVLVLAAYPIAVATMLDAGRVVAEAPDLLRHLAAQAFGAQGVTIFGRRYPPDQLVHGLLAGVSKLVGGDFAAAIAGAGLSAVLAVFLTLVLMPYFLISGPRLARGVIWLIPPERRHSVLVVLPRILPALRRYLIGIFLVVTYTGVVAWIGFGPVFGLAHPLLMAATIGVLELVPVVGPLASATIVGLVAIQQPSLWHAAFLMAFAIGLRLSIDNLVGPLVIGQAARLHPVVVIMSFVFGAMLFGVVGLMLAVPTAVCLKITLEHYYAEPVAKAPD